MFWVRLRSSTILAIITLVTVIMGGNILFAVTGAISIIGLTELYKVQKADNTLLGFAGYLACAVYYLLLLFDLKQYLMAMLIAFFFLIMLVYVFSFPKYNSEQVSLIFFGFFYVAVMLSYIYQVRMYKDGIWLVWLIFIGAWGCDTFAYCVGMLIGKHKMSPKLSPKKSVEGGIGGILGAALVGFIYGTIAKSHVSGIANPQLGFAIICGASGFISQMGDLAASAIKRNHNMKDYGKLIPGHGGILDRFDSIIFTAPIVYFLTELLK